jgi:hypothetical protein
MGDTERENMKRLDALEERIRGTVASQVEGAVDSNIGSRLQNLERKLVDSASAKATELSAAITAHSRAWMLPVGLLFAAVALMSICGWRVYAKARKTHLL